MPRPRAVDWINASAVLAAVVLSSSAALRDATPAAERAPEDWRGLPSVEPVASDAGLALLDATGTRVGLGPYTRVASGSSIADSLLLELGSPEQIVAFSARSARGPDAYRFAGKPTVDARKNVEALLELRPDLVLVNSLGEHAWVQRLRDAGLTVFDLGPMRGLETFLGNVAAVGHLLGRAERAREFAGHYRARLRAIARHLPREARKSGLYVSVQGAQLYGGTRGSSYHDVLEHGGVVDTAAARFEGWPTYTPESVLLLDPELIVTATGMAAALCSRPELARLRACGARGKVIEITPQLLDDAGIHMLATAELIHRAAYGDGGP